MDVSASSSAVSASTSFSDRLLAQMAAARTKAGLATAASASTAAPTQTSVLASANTTIFGLAKMVGQVRSLSSTASSLQASNATGVDALRKQVSAALTAINALTTTGSTASTTATASTTTSTPAAPLTLDQLRSTLADMQDNLHTNISKIGASVVKALAYSAQPAVTASNAQSLFSSTMANIIANPKAAIWAQSFALNSSTFTRSA